jgi:excisionase family DNA binding protein
MLHRGYSEWAVRCAWAYGRFRLPLISALHRCQLDLGQKRKSAMQTDARIELAPAPITGMCDRIARSPTSAGRPTDLAQLLLTESEAAERLAVSPRTLRKARQTGALHYIAIGRSVRYTLSDLESFIAALRQVPPNCSIACPSRKSARPNGKQDVIVPFTERDKRR